MYKITTTKSTKKNHKNIYSIYLCYNTLLTFIYIYIYAFIQRDLQCIQVIHVLSVHVFTGNRTHNLCAAKAMLLTTEPQEHSEYSNNWNRVIKAENKHRTQQKVCLKFEFYYLEKQKYNWCESYRSYRNDFADVKCGTMLCFYVYLLTFSVLSLC